MNYLKITGIIFFPIFCFIVTLFALIVDPHFTYSLLDSVGKSESIAPTKQLFKAAVGVGSVPSQFNEKEQGHLMDVVFLMRLGFLLFILSMLFFAYLIKRTNFIKKGFYFSIILLLILIIMPFKIIFTIFHLILFPQGNWTFPADSIIIQTFPFEFFYFYAISLLLYSIFFAFMLYYSNKSLNYIFNHAKV